MSFCSWCGRKMSEDEKVCVKCGGSPQIVESPKEDMQEAANNNNVSKLNVINPDEQILATLGNGYGVNALYGNVKKCHAILTDKRVYFHGTLFEDDGKNLKKRECKKIVNVEDITGTGFDYSAFSLMGLIPYIPIVVLFIIVGVYFGPITQRSWGIAWLGYSIALLSGIMGFVIQYYKSKFTLFNIEYPGGKICFDAHIVGLDSVSDFQKQISRAKDKLKKSSN